MSDAELSRDLALAIGWPESAITVTHGQCFIWYGRDGRDFDYRDPAVIWPIAERYNCFPLLSDWGRWSVAIEHPITFMSIRVSADTAAEAVARAVIGGKA